MADVKITTEDIQAAMVEDPKVALRVQVIAHTRTVEEYKEEITRLTEELNIFKNGKNGKNAKEK